MSIFSKASDFLANINKPFDWADFYFERSKKIAEALHPFGVPLLEKENKLSGFFVADEKPDLFGETKLIPIIPPEKSELLGDYTLITNKGVATGLSATIRKLPNDDCISEGLYKEAARIISNGIHKSFQDYEADTKQTGVLNRKWDITGESKDNFGPNYYRVVHISLQRISGYDPEDFATNVFESPETLARMDSRFSYLISYSVEDTFHSLRAEQIKYYRKLYANYINLRYVDLSNGEKKEYNEKIFNGKLATT